MPLPYRLLQSAHHLAELLRVDDTEGFPVGALTHCEQRRVDELAALPAPPGAEACLNRTADGHLFAAVHRWASSPIDDGFFINPEGSVAQGLAYTWWPTIAEMRREADGLVSARGYTVTVTQSAGADGATVIFIDGPDHPDPDSEDLNGLLPDGTPRLRIRLNDGLVFAAVPYQPVDPTIRAQEERMADALATIRTIRVEELAALIAKVQAEPGTQKRPHPHGSPHDRRAPPGDSPTKSNSARTHRGDRRRPRARANARSEPQRARRLAPQGRSRPRALTVQAGVAAQGPTDPLRLSLPRMTCKQRHPSLLCLGLTLDLDPDHPLPPSDLRWGGQDPDPGSNQVHQHHKSGKTVRSRRGSVGPRRANRNQRPEQQNNNRTERTTTTTTTTTTTGTGTRRNQKARQSNSRRTGGGERARSGSTGGPVLARGGEHGRTNESERTGASGRGASAGGAGTGGGSVRSGSGVRAGRRERLHNTSPSAGGLEG
jgi:hypothetical protein